MTDKQPEALRLANDLEIDYGGDVVAHEAAAELRRLHKENETLKAQRDELLTMFYDARMNSTRDDERLRRIEKLEVERDELLAALESTLPALIRLGDFVGNADVGEASGMGRIDRCALIGSVRAAIKVAEEGK